MYNSTEHDPLIRQAAAKHGIPPDVLWGLMQTESGGRPRQGPATDNFGNPLRDRADGYFQFTEETANRYGVSRGNFASEVDGAARYLSDLQKKKGDLWEALSTYGGHVKADPDPYITKILEKSAGSPFRVKQDTGEDGDLDAQILKALQGRKAPEDVPTNMPRPVINPGAKASPVGKPAKDLSDEEVLGAVGFLPPLVGGVVGGIAGSAVGAIGGPATAIAGGALGGGAGTGWAVYREIKQKFPDIDDERAKKLAFKEGAIDAGMSAGLGVAFKGVGAARRAGAFTPVEEYLARISGKVPRSASSVGSGAIEEYQKAATVMSKAIDGQLSGLRGELGTVDEVGVVFNRARQETADEVRQVLERQYAPLKPGAAAGDVFVPVRNVGVDDALANYQNILRSSPTLISPKVQQLVELLTPGGARIKDAPVHRLIGYRKEIDNLINWDKDGDISREAAEKVLKPLRTALNDSITDGLRAKGYPIEAGKYVQANKSYSQMMSLLNNEFLVKLADKDPEAMIRFAGSKAGTEGFEKVEEAVGYIVKNNPKYKPEDAAKFLDGIRSEYTKTMLNTNAKMVGLADVLTNPQLDPGMYRSFQELFKGNLGAKKAVEDAVAAARAVTNFADDVNLKAGKGGLGQGGVTAAVSTAGMIGGAPAVAGTSSMIAFVTGPFARATARAVTDGNKEMLQKSRWISKFLRNTAATSTAATINSTEIPEKIEQMMRELEVYGTAEEGAE